MNRNKFHIIISIFFGVQIISGCALNSTFKIEPDQNKKFVFQFCGGQQWGYIKPLSDKKKAPYISVYLENHVSSERTDVAVNFVIQTQEDTEIVFKNRVIKIQKDGVTVSDKPTSFWLIRGEKPMWELYPSEKYTSKQISPNEWEIRKKKYGGFFGYMALEDLFIVKTNTYKNEETKSDTIKVNLDKNLNEIYFMNSSFAFPIKKDNSRPLTISVRTPEFQVNGITVQETNYTFHFDQNKLIAEIKDTARCASLVEVFRAGRNKDSWIWWMYPKIKD